MPQSAASDRQSHSLRRRIAAWMLPPLILLALVNAILSYQSARDAADVAYDRALVATMRAIAESTHSVNGDILVDIPASAFDNFEHQATERIYYAVIGPGGAVLTGYGDLPRPPKEADAFEPLLSGSVYRGRTIRLGALAKRMYDPALGADDRVTVLFAETVDSRIALARELFVESLRRQLVLIAIGMAILYAALSTAFRPLIALRNAVRARSNDDLRPISDRDVPSEVRPLIDAINHQMQRLENMIAARRRFFADAAHQIRTPLAVISTQTEYGLRQQDAEELHATFRGLQGSVANARRLADQMLAMSRAEAVGGTLDEVAEVDLITLTKDVSLQLAPLALQRDIDLAFEDATGTAAVRGNASLLRDLISNLIDNAIRYSGRGGHVLITVGGDERQIALTVRDDGPGIPEHERENVFKRFYRVLGGNDSTGSGLGLSIVREICWSHGGTITLGDGAEGKGLTVLVRLPRA